MSDLAKFFRARRHYHKEHMAGLGFYRPASEALTLAREDIAKERKLYSVPAANGRLSDSGHGAPFTIGSESRVVWIERPESIGLRFVGAAHDIVKSNYAYSHGLGHAGWFLDNFQGETAHGVVYQLPGRNGAARFMYGVADPHDDGPAMLSLDIVEGELIDYHTFLGDPSYDQGARDAASNADSMAESYAESCREHNSAANAGYEFGTLGETVKEQRRELLAILAERKRVANVESPTLCNVIRGRVDSILGDIRQARERRAELLSEWEAAEPDDSANEYQRERWELFQSFQDAY